MDLVQTAFREGGDGGRGHLAYRGIDTKGEKVVQGHWASRGDGEGCGGNLTSPTSTAITYHDFLHGFWAGRGTGTATLEAELLQQLAAMREEVL